MFCKYCGNEIDDNCCFCSKCGKRVVSDNERGNRTDNEKMKSLEGAELVNKGKDTAINGKKVNSGAFGGKIKSIISAVLCILLVLGITGVLDPLFEKIGNMPIFKGNDTKGVFQDNTSYVIKEEAKDNNESSDTLSDFALNIYGTYTYDNGQTDVMIANIGAATGDGSDYIYISALSYGDRYTAEFMGTLVQTGDNTYTVSDEWSNCFVVVFDSNGMQITIEHIEFSTFEVFEGYYEKTEELDFSNVG